MTILQKAMLLLQVVHTAAEVKGALQSLLPAIGRSMLFLRKLKDVVLMHLDEENEARTFMGQVSNSFLPGYATFRLYERIRMFNEKIIF